ncbi:M6 family metalloprotease domain-containing protein [Streptomyces sp. NPDC127110]|uniref:M6 family metalloprotease domain-containing protein n=1 Tax=Streptomyces sp. NPDC127110 TaxID=3345362 RepID=UPI0036270355
MGGHDRTRRRARRVAVLMPALLALGAASCAGGRPAAGGPYTPPAAPTADATAPCGLQATQEGAEGPTDFEQYVRPKGTVRAVMLFVDFPDAPAAEKAAGRHDAYRPAADWYRTASYGQLDLKIDPLLRWVRMPKASTAYGMEPGYSAATHAAYITDALTAAKAADPALDLSGRPIVYVVATLSAGEIDTRATAAYVAGEPVKAGPDEILTAATFFGDDEHHKYRVVVHESGHLFGLPDLYPSAGGGNGAYVGEYDVMAEETGRHPDFLAWHKHKLGWLTPAQVHCVRTPGTTEHHLSPVETAPGVKAVVIPTGKTTALAAEVRARTGVDAEACRTGVLVYSVDTAAGTGKGPIRLLGPRPPKDYPCQAAYDLSAGGTAEYRSPDGRTVITLIHQDADGSYTLRVARS